MTLLWPKKNALDTSSILWFARRKFNYNWRAASMFKVLEERSGVDPNRAFVS
eukprot:m.23178 g.23178  ORF g.23178 m.23178 type:complete len:52 (-) comp12915_c0_seq2:690-845(-)